VGTVRADGSPRLSPIEPVFLAGHLYLDMMWRSRKAVDALRDPRLEVHAIPRNAQAPQCKVRGTLLETHDAEEPRRFAACTLAHLGWEPYPRHHLFRLDIEGAAWISYGEGAPDGCLRLRKWDAAHGHSERAPYPPAGSALNAEWRPAATASAARMAVALAGCSSPRGETTAASVRETTPGHIAGPTAPFRRRAPI
jgi:hypothetical protein